MPIPHDAFLKLLYRAGIRDAITLFFPDLAGSIDWAGLRWVEKEVLIPGVKPRSVIADLVGLTRDIDGRSLELLIHPEIQMHRDADMDWRVLQYIAGLTLQEANPDARVLTFVFYHCPGTGGVRDRRYVRDFQGYSILECGYWSVGLGDLEAGPYVESDNPMAWALVSWMRKPPVDRATLRLRLQKQVVRSVEDEIYRGLLVNTMRSYFRLSEAEQQQEAELLHSDEDKEMNDLLRDYLHTEFGRLEAKGERRGLRKGMRKGHQEGMQQGERKALQDALLDILHSRFTSVPQATEGQIRGLDDVSQLRDLLHRSLSAASLADLGLPTD